MLGHRRADGGPTLTQHWFNVSCLLGYHRGGVLFVITGRHLITRVRILVQVTIYRRLWIGRDGHLDQSKAYDIS